MQRNKNAKNKNQILALWKDKEINTWRKRAGGKWGEFLKIYVRLRATIGPNDEKQQLLRPGEKGDPCAPVGENASGCS